MTARILMPADADALIDGEKRAKRDERCVRDGFAGPDQYLHGVLDALEVDGVRVKATARLRGYLRHIQKLAEAGR
jgi:hypothetical protein